MKVVMPWAHWWPEAVEALRHSSQHSASFVHMTEPGDYWRLVVDLWNAGEPFVLVEHDIVVRPNTVSDLATCPYPWCAYVYHEAPGEPVSGLGCTKITPGAQPLAAEPEVVWQNVDTVVQGQMTALGWQVHEHHPWLRHLNPKVAGQQA